MVCSPASIGAARRRQLVRGSPRCRRAADRNLTDDNWVIVERLEGFAAECGHTLLDLALSWLAQRPAVASVIAGATKPEQVEEKRPRLSAWAI